MRFFTIILSLCRPLNLLIAIASVFIMAAIIDDVSWMLLIYPCFVLVCYMSAANMLNDLVDIKSDSINKPKRVLVRHPVNRHLILFIVGLFFGLFFGQICFKKRWYRVFVHELVCLC